MPRRVSLRSLPSPLTVLLIAFLVALFRAGGKPAREERTLQWIPTKGYSGFIEAVSFSGDGARLCLVGRDGAESWWNPSLNHEEQLTRECQGYAYRPSFTAGATAVAVVTADDHVVVEDFDSRRRIAALPHPTDSLSTLVLSRDGKLVAIGEEGGAIEVWEVDTGRRRFRVQRASTRINCMTFSPDGSVLAAGGSNGILTMWDTTGGSIKIEIDQCRLNSPDHCFLPPLSKIAFAPDGKTLASLRCDHREVELWDVATGQPRAVLRGALHPIKSIALSPDGGLVACGDLDGGVTVWDARSHQERMVLSGHSTQVSSLSFSPDGRRLASGDSDSVVKIWNVESS